MLSGSNECRAESLFVRDCLWRDLLAVTGTLQTLSGVEKIQCHLAGIVNDSVEVSVSRHFPPFRSSLCGRPTTDVFVDLHLPNGRVCGLVRLVEVDDNDRNVKAWTLLTSLEELWALPESTGHRRPKGVRNFGSRNWRDVRNDVREFADSDPEVLVVGAGQAGLSIAARLTQLGVSTLVVESAARVGDNWRNRYDSLTLHNEVWANHLPYLPFPASWPIYISKDKLANWLESYVESMEINCWTGTTFLKAEYIETEQNWRASVERKGVGQIELRPNHVVMATGVSGIPNVPTFEGIDNFTGRVLHSNEFVTGTEYSGQRVLVFGTGNSGHDIAQDLYASEADVSIVQRGSTTVVSLDPSAKSCILCIVKIPPPSRVT